MDGWTGCFLCRGGGCRGC